MVALKIPASPEDVTADWLSGALHSGSARIDATVASFDADIIGVGVGFLHLRNPAATNEPTSRGPAGSWWSGGASYEWFVSPRGRSGGLSLSPTVQARFVPGNGTAGIAVFLGLEGTLWTGLPGNRLAFPATGPGVPSSN